MSAEEITQNFQRFGCHHIACGRYLHNSQHLAAAPWLEAKMRGVAPSIEPVRHIIEGARSYASLRGLSDPHASSYDHVRQNADRIHYLARTYDSLPLHDPHAVPHFEAMRNEVRHQYDHLTNRMGVKVETVDHDPYASAYDMAHDLRTNKRIQVLGTHATGSHPFFSHEDNDKFRAVHDAFGHAATGRDFDGHGEEAAFHAHARMFSHIARGALATETTGQNGSVIMHDRFGPQKVAVMPQHLWTPDGMRRDASMVNDYRMHRRDQEDRAERASNGYEPERRAFYGDPNQARGDTIEKSLTYQDFLKANDRKAHPDERAHLKEYSQGYDLGVQHGDQGQIDESELNKHYNRSSHPEHFSDGYQVGLDEGMSTVAVHLGYADPDAKSYSLGGIPKIAHVSGNSIDVLHCFAGETRYLTRDGVKTLGETVGTIQQVMTGEADPRGGRWVDAIIHEFGEQPLLTVTVQRNKQRKTIRATPEHTWFLAAGPKRDRIRKVKTTELRPGHRLPHLRLPHFWDEPDHHAIRLGFVFGDGSIHKSGSGTAANVVLYGPKQDLCKFFEEVVTTTSHERLTDNGVEGTYYGSGMSGYTKTLPSLTAPREFLLGWLMGYFAADGSVFEDQGQATLSCASIETLLHVRDIATLLGIGTYAPTSKMRQGFGPVPTLIHQLGFSAVDLGESFFLREDQRVAAREQHHERFGWTVVSVENHGERETVYCPRVAGTESFVLEDNIHTGQCPFCGSGALVARSDGTVECSYCTSCFTVQTQPQYAAFPQTAEGAPYPWPGQPDPGSVVAPGPVGQGLPPGDPDMTGAGGAPDDINADPGDDEDAPPWAQGDDGGGDDEDDADDDSGGSAPPFTKKDKSGKSKATVKGKTAPPFGGKKSSSLYKNSRGTVLTESDYIKHLSILHARNPAKVASLIKGSRR